MRIAFRASEGRFEADESALVCGLAGRDAAGAEHYLLLQRAPEDEHPGEDWGVYLEYDDQSAGAYNRVARCRVERERISVDLSGPLGPLAGVDGFDVALALGDGPYEQVRAGLRRIFRGMPGALETA